MYRKSVPLDKADELKREYWRLPDAKRRCINCGSVLPKNVGTFFIKRTGTTEWYAQLYVNCLECRTQNYLERVLYKAGVLRLGEELKGKMKIESYLRKTAKKLRRAEKSLKVVIKDDEDDKKKIEEAIKHFERIKSAAEYFLSTATYSSSVASWIDVRIGFGELYETRRQVQKLITDVEQKIRTLKSWLKNF